MLITMHRDRVDGNRSLIAYPKLRGMHLYMVFREIPRKEEEW